MANETRQKLVHLHTGENRAPSASVLNYGEIAVMHNEAAPSLFIKAGENEATKVAQFIDKVQTEALIDTKISASTQEMIALKSDVVTERGRIDSLEDSVITAMTVNGVDATLTPANLGNGNLAEVTIDSDDVNVGTAITYSGETFIGTAASTTEALQALANKVADIDGVISESNHNHTNKAVLDGITSEKVSSWDQAATDDHTHSNKALLDTYTQTEADLADAVSKKHEHANASVLDGISAEDVQAWNDAVDALDDKVDVVEGKGLSTNDYTDAEKEKLATIAASAQTNVIEAVKVNGTALTVTDKAVDILVAEGTANGTVKVNGVDVNVHGLGSAAYEDKTAFDASGAADTVKTELIGDMTGATKTLGGLEDRIDALTTGSNVSISTATTTEGYLKTYTFSQNGSEIGKIDIPKDLVVTSGQIVEVNDVKYLRLTIANQDSPVDIAVADLVDVYTQGSGIEISTGNVISAKVVAGNGLSLDSNGIAMAAASADGAGAMSSADFTKLAGIASGAQANVLEGVQVNGADLTPDANKKVNVTVAAGTNNGTIAVNGSDVAVTGLKSAAFEDASAFDESGAAATAKSEVIGDMSGSTKTLGALQGAIASLESGLGTAAAADTSDFDAAGAAEAASAAAITAVVGDMTGSTKTLGALQDEIEGLHVGDDNVLEGVQVNGSDLTPDANKKVNVTVAEGSTNGTIAVNGSDVAVHGLGSAAYADTTAFDAAGAAGAASAAAVTAVVGTAQDASGATTVYGAKAYADQKASDAQAAAEAAVVGTAQDASGATTVYGAKAYADQVAAEAQAAAANALQGIESGKESGAAVNANHELDFTGFGIDCGEY